MKRVWSSGEPFIWLTGGALTLSLLLVAGLIGLILYNGLGFFWPRDVVRLTLVGWRRDDRTDRGAGARARGSRGSTASS